MGLGRASGSLASTDRLPEAVGAALRGGHALTLRLPSDPMVAFDGGGPFAINSAFRRELDALADLAIRRGAIQYDLCMVAVDHEARAHPDPGKWNAQRLDYLREALKESGHHNDLGVCGSGVKVLDGVPMGDDDPCDPYREALSSQTLLIISSDLL